MKTVKEVIKELESYSDKKIEEIVNKASEKINEMAKIGRFNSIKFLIDIDNLSDEAEDLRVDLVRKELESLGFYTCEAGYDEWSFNRIIAISVNPISKFNKFLYRIGWL